MFRISRAPIRIAAVTAALIALPTVGYAVNFADLPATPANEDPEPAPAEEPAAAPEGEEFDAEMIARGLEAFKEGGCRSCHGWAANGDREGPTPQGPSLRDSAINFEGIVYTVSCGRLSSEMPYFRRDAYREEAVCGMTRDAAGDMIPPRAQNLLDEQEIADLAAYLVGYVQGRGEITFEECEDFFGEGATRCDFYRN